MDAGFERRVLERFDELVELAPAARDTALGSETDARLREAVRALLTQDEQTAGIATIPPRAEIEPAPPLPDRVGPWRLEEKIGEGGMGSVWRAVRGDGLFEQTVAIKFIRPEILSGRSREYFDRERRILGRLRHPGIARILDAGATEDGHGWLAMDFVQGQPIVEALAGATLTARLSAFRRAAEAVRFAHRNLVVHADLKPSNILVEDDGALKLLDFGIAHIFDPSGDSAAPHAAEPMTRSHAAPERLAGGPPTVATDIYALGVVLFELLAGTLPGQMGEATTRLEPGGEPVAVRTTLWPLVSSLARDPAVPAALLKGDLDAVAAKALAADPHDRYLDAGALLADLDRHGEGRPVSSLAGNRAHALRRFVARNRRALAVGAVVAALLLSATLVSVLAYSRAERQRAEAEARFTELRGLSRFILFDATDDLQMVPGSAPIRARLAQAGQSYLEGLSLTRDAPIEVLYEAGEAQLRLATISGVAGMGGIGDADRAPALIGRAERIFSDVLRRDPRHARAMAELGWASLSRWALAGPAEGAELLARGRRWLARASAIDPSLERARLGEIIALRAQAFDAVWASDYAAAERIARAGLASLRGQRFGGAALIDARIAQAGLFMRLGDALYYQDKPEEALAAYRDAGEVMRRAIRRHGRVPRLLSTLAEAHWNIGSTIGDRPGATAAALAEIDSAIPLLDRVLSYGPDERAASLLPVLLGQKAVYLVELGRTREALVTAARALAMREEMARAAPDNADRRRSLAVSLHTITDIHAALGDSRSACASATRATAIWTAIERNGDLSEQDRTGEAVEMRGLQAEACAA